MWSHTGKRLMGSSPLHPRLFDHSNGNPIIYLTEGGELEDISSRSGQLGKPAGARHQNPIKKTQG